MLRIADTAGFPACVWGRLSSLPTAWKGCPTSLPWAQVRAADFSRQLKV